MPIFRPSLKVEAEIPNGIARRTEDYRIMAQVTAAIVTSAPAGSSTRKLGRGAQLLPIVITPLSNHVSCFQPRTSTRIMGIIAA
ncbi:MAG: hypothetical protein BZY75_05015 [SAR202 cluster bacterium Io17-Chloro-G7]|nr:MAG: hypothetical protein BZY75_05015 [SAR202 cluster bacterium Io17-Chloro-G7]